MPNSHLQPNRQTQVRSSFAFELFTVTRAKFESNLLGDQKERRNSAKKQQKLETIMSSDNKPVALNMKSKRSHLKSAPDAAGTKPSEFLLYFACVLTVCALAIGRAEALSLISEKCDPNKVGPDETTVKGGWQAEMFNGLAFRTCGK